MRVLVSVMPFAGHVAPLSGVVAELLARGHEVTVYSGSRYRQRFEALGARFVPWQAAPDFDEHNLSRTFPQVGRAGARGLLANLEYLFIRSAEGQARDLLDELAHTRYDLLAGDVMSLGCSIAAEVSDVPWATVSIVPLSLPSRDLPPMGLALHPGRGRLGHLRDAVLRGVLGRFTGRLDRALDEVRASHGLPRTALATAWYSPTLVIATGSPSIEYPRTDLGNQFHFVGRILPAGAVATEIASAAPSHPARVLVTQGTFNTEPSELLQPTLRALSSRPVSVLATTGRTGVVDVGMPVPANARVVDLARFDLELATTAIAITNGGWGGVLEMLAAGVPLIVAGGDLDKPEIAARVGWSGAGIDLRTGRPTAAAVGKAVDRLLADPRYRERAQIIARELRSLGGTATAVDLLEALVG